ncbi:hypothetical protein HJC23_002581 [Cyclotella cryptica]|uniref:Uncharacterized protein n=1 Tax=Cyclotella cryptica TaxID=29204 RepID=A0ABD3QWB5_9STRA|eukprot:CCRYP_001446-RA/>CCRYP_001446-RA protein AED:0.07 eAED:0.07 QI:664/1/1/1/0/0/2/156/362
MRNFNKKLCLSLSALLSTQTQAQTIIPDIAAANTTFNSDQCSYWLFTAQASDSDASGGLSPDEYYTFLTSIDDPPYIDKYFEGYPDFSSLPWKYRVLYKTMTCNCMRLGQGANCCTGPDAEAMFDMPNNATVYANLLCQQIQFLVSQVEEPVQADVPLETPPPTPAPQGVDESISTDGVVNEPVASTGTVTETEPEDAGSGGLGAGAVVGYVFAVFIPLCAGCFIFLHQRKLEEEKRLREFAGEAAKEDALANFDAADAELHPTLEPVTEPEEETTDQQIFDEKKDSNDKNNDSDDGSSVWSDGDGKEEGEKEIIVDENEDTQKQTVGSALAAMGVASTVATSIIAPTLKKSHDVEDRDSLV